MKKLFILSLILIIQLSFSQDSKIEIFKKQGKFGLVKNSKVFIPAQYDSIKFEKNSLSLFNNYYKVYRKQYFDILSSNGNKLIANIKALSIMPNFSFENIQVIDSLNQTYFITSTGQKLPSDKIKSTFEAPELIDKEQNYDAVTSYIISSPNNIKSQTFFYNYSNPNSNKKGKTEYKEISSPQNSIFTKFIYNDSLTISFYKESEGKNIYKDHPYNAAFSQYQVIVKKNNKFGVWNLSTHQFDLPIIYDEIQVFNQNLILKQNNLYTSFPNIGKKVKYKRLDPYIEYFARFETPDNKKGWVDRKGKEYFDQ